MQFFAVSVFSWMITQVIDMYLAFAKAIYRLRLLGYKACLVGWGFPTLVVIVTISVHFGLINNASEINQEQRMFPLYRETAM